MAAPTPRAEVIAETLVDLIRQQVIEGDDYHYTPDRVERAHAFTKEVLLGGHDVIYILSPAEQEDTEQTYVDTEGLARLDLTVARRLRAATEDPLKRTEGDELRWTVQNNLVHDAKKAIRGDKKLTSADYPDGVALHTSIPLTELSAEDTYLPGWALAYMALEVMFSFPDAQP